MKRKDDPEKYCAVCTVRLRRKRYGRTLESNLSFRNRRHCSLSCANTRTDLTKHGYSWRARKHLKAKCEACWGRRKLQAHHVDQDIRNNDPENIQTLCKVCHDFWHSAGRRRGWMVVGRMACLASQRA